MSAQSAKSARSAASIATVATVASATSAASSTFGPKKGNVWVLLITYEEDDWKERYGAADPEVFVFDSKEKCEQTLQKRLIRRCKEAIMGLSKKEWMNKAVEVHDYFTVQFDDDGQICKCEYSDELLGLHGGTFPVDALYEWESKGEYVTRYWWYDIRECDVF